MGRRLYCGNLGVQVTDKDLEDLFGDFGDVLSAEVIYDRATRQSKGYGFFEMSTDAEAEAAIEGMNGIRFEDRPMTVNESPAPR